MVVVCKQRFDPSQKHGSRRVPKHGWPDYLYGPYYARRLPGGDGPPKFRAQPSWYSCGSWGFVLLLEGCKSSIVVCVYLFFIEFLLFIYVRAINILIRFRASNLLRIPSQGNDAEPFFKFFFKIPLPFDLCLSETKWNKKDKILQWRQLPNLGGQTRMHCGHCFF